MYNKNLLSLIVLSINLIIAAPVMASEQAASFVQQKVSRVLSILSNPALNEKQKADQFQDEILRITDVNVISRFVLGQYAAKASRQELEDFRRNFRLYVLDIYQSELSRFGNEVLEVHSTQDRKPGDSVVLTTLSGGALSKKAKPVKWRVLIIKGEPRVVDIEISGVWISQHQRAEITEIIAKNSGRISAASKFLCTHSAECTYTG